MSQKVIAVTNRLISLNKTDKYPLKKRRLNSLLYFAWGEYWIFYKEHLFEDDFDRSLRIRIIDDMIGGVLYVNKELPEVNYKLSEKEIESIDRTYRKHIKLDEWNLYSDNKELLPKDMIKHRFETIDYIYTNFGRLFAELAKI